MSNLDTEKIRTAPGDNGRENIMNNEEKILEMLAELMATQRSQGELLARVDERSQRTAVLMETEVMDKLNLLYEGHGLIMETLAPKDRVDELEADVVVLKSAVKMLTQEVAELKKAQ